MAGGLPNNEKRLRIINLRDLKAEAHKVITPFGFSYFAAARATNGRCVKILPRLTER